MTSTKKVLAVSTRVPEISSLKALGTWFPAYKQLMLAFYEMLSGAGAPYELNWQIIDVPHWLKNSLLSEMHESLQFGQREATFLLNGPKSGHQQNVNLTGKISAAVRIEGSEGGWLFVVNGTAIEFDPTFERVVPVKMVCYFDAISRKGFVVMPTLLVEQL